MVINEKQPLKYWLEEQPLREAFRSAEPGSEDWKRYAKELENRFMWEEGMPRHQNRVGGREIATGWDTELNDDFSLIDSPDALFLHLDYVLSDTMLPSEEDGRISDIEAIKLCKRYLKTYGPLAGVADPPDELGYQPPEIIRKLVRLRESGDENEGDRGYIKWFGDRIRRYGANLLPIALRIVQEEDKRSRNTIRQGRVDLKAERVEPPFLVKGVIPSGVPSSICGLMSVGKSLAGTVGLACSLATGTPWLGRDVSESRVLILNVEDPDFMVADRVDAWVNRYSVDPGDRLDFISPSAFSFTSGPGVDDLIEVIREDGIEAVIVDNLAAAMTDASNMSDTDVGTLINALGSIVRAGATPILIAHTNAHDDSIAGLSKQENLLNTILHIRAVRDGEREIRLRKSKLMDRTKVRPIPFHIVDSGVERNGEKVGVIVGQDDGARDAIEKALAALGEPATKSAIDAKVREMGHGIRRENCLQLIEELADDEQSSVVRCGTKFALT